MTTRVIVTGSRDFVDFEFMLTTLEGLHRLWPDAELVIVHGAAKGADNLAEAAAKRLGYATEPHPADWKTYGRAAGPARNKAMVDKGADLCLGFPIGESKGTRGCMQLAANAGIRTMNVTEGKEVLPK